MKKGWLLLMAVAMLGCQSVRQEPSSDLVVVEQTDSVDGGREEIWKGAKTLDDLRKKPDEVKISKNKDF